MVTQMKMVNENAGEDCNLSDDEEEKASNIQTQQKKAYLSMDKIMDKIIREHEQSTTSFLQTSMASVMREECETEDQFGTLAKL